MPCAICQNNMARTLSHARTALHKKLLFKLMRERIKNGYYSKTIYKKSKI